MEGGSNERLANSFIISKHITETAGFFFQRLMTTVGPHLYPMDAGATALFNAVAGS